MASSLIRRAANATRAQRRAAVKGLRPSLRSTHVRVRRRRTAKIRVRG